MRSLQLGYSDKPVSAPTPTTIPLFQNPASYFPTYVPHLISTVPTDSRDSDRSTWDTIQLMASYARHCANTPIVQQRIKTALKDGVPPFHSNKKDVIRKLYHWIKANIEFVEDEQVLKEVLQIPQHNLDKELLLTPDFLVEMPTPMGDCDDFSTLLASMLIGSDIQVPVYFVTVACEPMEPNRFSHVYVMVEVDGELLPLDSSHGKYPGWELPSDMIYRKMYWKVY